MADEKKSVGSDNPAAGAAAMPGDNRTADDVDGNRSGGASKTQGVKEPAQPSNDKKTAGDSNRA